MTTKFKTNIKCDGCVAKVTPSLNEIAGESHWSVDLKDPQRILTIDSEMDEQKINLALNKVGYKAERLQN
ncbi:MAG TPA: hypothetical protein DGG95_04155 [Cytophagales bacterium]|jgi:copper chaperone|nr:hypothetical protein [Cytophagales bacterium]